MVYCRCKHIDGNISFLTVTGAYNAYPSPEILPIYVYQILKVILKILSWFIFKWVIQRFSRKVFLLVYTNTYKYWNALLANNAGYLSCCIANNMVLSNQRNSNKLKEEGLSIAPTCKCDEEKTWNFCLRWPNGLPLTSGCYFIPNNFIRKWDSFYTRITSAAWTKEHTASMVNLKNS